MHLTYLLQYKHMPLLYDEITFSPDGQGDLFVEFHNNDGSSGGKHQVSRLNQDTGRGILSYWNRVQPVSSIPKRILHAVLTLYRLVSSPQRSKLYSKTDNSTQVLLQKKI
jgi:hypothetical protein